MKRFMNKPQESRRLLFGNKNKRDDRGSAIVIVIISMALIGILASTILWASYLNYRIKINDLKVKNSFYSAETVVEQIVAGVKKDVVSTAVNEAYQEVVSNWDALGTDSNRESFFVMEYIEQVKENLGVGEVGTPAGQYDREILEKFVDDAFWDEDNTGGYIVGGKDGEWKSLPATFRTYEENRADNGNSNMTIKNICVEFVDGNGLLSIINTDIAIDVPKLRFTQAGTIDRLYPYVFVGDGGFETEKNAIVEIDGSIYAGVDDQDEGGIEIGENSRVTVENASYIISGGDIVIGNADDRPINMVNQGAELIVRDVSSSGVGYGTNVYAKGLVLNGSHLDISGRVFVENDLILSGRGSIASLSGQYFGYGGEMESVPKEKMDADGNDMFDDEGRQLYENPASQSSAIVINGKDSTVDLTGLNTLQLAGRAYVSLDDDLPTSNRPHILMGESISVKSNQIAYLVPPECVGTLDGKTVIGQNPVSFTTWSEMISSLPDYAADGKEFKIVDAGRYVTKLGGEKSLNNYGIGSIAMEDLNGVDLGSDMDLFTEELNRIGKGKNIRFVYMAEKEQVYMYLVMDKTPAEQYFTAYYNVNSNKDSLDNYFNQYASGGIKLKENVQGYTVVGNSMVSLTDAGSGDNIVTGNDGENLVRLLSSVTPPEDEGEGEGDDQPQDPDAYKEVSDNITNIDRVRTQDELEELMKKCAENYKNLNINLMEENTGLENTVFDNLIIRETPTGSVNKGLQEYLDERGGEVVFETKTGTGDSLYAVLVDAEKNGTYQVTDSNMKLVIAIGDVNVKCNFQGIIIASGKITVEGDFTCKKNGEGVYNVLQATNKDDPDDPNVPANVLRGGSGMVENGYEGTETDEFGNVSIDYSEIVRYENWIKK